MMDGDAIRELKAAMEESRGQGAIVTVDGQSASTVPLYEGPKPPVCEQLTLGSLSSLVAFVLSGFDFEPDKVQVCVRSPWGVTVHGPLDADRQRECLANVAMIDPLNGKLGHWMNSEDFIIMLQTLFRHDITLDEVFEIVGNIASEAEVRVEDDGVSQSVTVTSGMKQQAKIPNPVTITPLRSFPEVDPVPQSFVFRMSGGSLSCKLLETSDGLWAREMCDDIRRYLEEQLPDTTIL